MSELNTQSLRTYGRRQGRPIKSTKQNLLDELLPTISVDLIDTEQRIDPQIYFDRPANVWMEVGFGGGEHLAQLAHKHPEINFIGCEPFLNGVASLLDHIHELKLTNVRIFQGNAIDLLKMLKSECLSRFYLMFADPWPKKRHHKRRFVQDHILDLVISKLHLNTELRLATDHEDYQQWMLSHLKKRTDLAESFCSFDKPQGWPNTRYEAKALQEGRKPLYMIYTRCK